MSRHLAAIIGAAAGAVALVGIVIFFIWFCLSHKRSVSRTSETGSSDPSVQVGRHVGVELSFRETRRFEMEELSLATKNFSDKQLIGEGKFGEVYEGWLNDGVLVAIKKRSGAPSQEFINEVRYLSPIRHRNLVTLLGYCQENNLQFLVYEHVPNKNISSHLYGTGQLPKELLEFKLRLTIALGAAKGLAHLHSQSPRLIHKNFKTANVLVDENFIPKVADAGLRNFLGRADIAGPSSQVQADEIFLSPEVLEFRRFSEKSDVYSFGVFLLELVSGREATESPSFDSNQNLVEWVQNNQEDSKFSNIIDQRLDNTFTAEGMEEVIQLIVQCVQPSSERRPTMSYVVMELDRIREKEISLTTVMGEGTPHVALGSFLFKTTE
ncbi:probable serine/threonine-protein kinase PBL3 isoform X1 [Quercus lobata]|uniref:non-specific serine/threonine protein kinase n=1 Tax=Quercus lobata TaxID=97700 RepID=A0A7N2KY07_QUELO|nr:probable serine/threonine-protein kinase PBL3 isoform X1 [Quercus lobata]XP_030953408.1 probable serine/threonine-protein kinase PBL3 isoform X1 [Quercus lobata]XP_030953409.1 probable serine/threonine-protein kinase PBL3 isoform X1 [Quercus lobata]